MYGAIIGDIVGSPFEFKLNASTKDFELFSGRSRFTDDTVMTIAVAQGLLDAGKNAELPDITDTVGKSMHEWGRRYPDSGYGSKFAKWLKSDTPSPYGSCGNGSAMRVSPAGWLYDNIKRTREVAVATASPTHNDPEGIKGAEATASAIYLARKGRTKEEIRKYIEDNFSYDLSLKCAEIRLRNRQSARCQETVPEALCAFLEGGDFIDVIRTAVSLGGDCDTLAAISGSVAEAFYGIPPYAIQEAKKRLPQEMLSIIDRFEHTLQSEKRTN